MKKIATATLALLALAVTTTVASAQLCTVPLIVSALIVSSQENRELTQKEAMTCGLIRDEDASKKAAAGKSAKTSKKKKAAQ